MRSPFARRFVPLFLALSAVGLAAPHASAGTEGAINPPDVLPLPSLASANATGEFAADVLRTIFEGEANWQLCEALLKDAKQPMPSPADFAHCPEPYRSRVKNHQGKVRWASNAEPTKCGTSCWNRPTNGRDQNRDRPNSNYASITGSLNFEVETPGPNRSVRYAWELFARCKVAPGARDGELDFRVVFQRPVVGEPSFFEGVLDFFLMPLDWTRQVDDALRARLGTPGSVSVPVGTRCTSIGAHAPPDSPPSAHAFRYDVPGTTTKPTLPGATLGRTATVHFTQLTRKPPPFGYPPPQESGTFLVYLNGVAAQLPQVPALPPAGGTAPIHYCKTVNLDGVDRLQVIFASSQGGAAWSQFSAGESFGESAAPRVLLAGHEVQVPVRAGSPPGTRPTTTLLRDYELTYVIDYSAPLTVPQGGAVQAKTVGPSASKLGGIGRFPTTPCKQI